MSPQFVNTTVALLSSDLPSIGSLELELIVESVHNVHIGVSGLYEEMGKATWVSEFR